MTVPAWSLEMMLPVSALAAAALLTELMRRIAVGSGVLDVPNPRSSHGVPTPRGGGVAIVLVTTAGLTVLALRGILRPDLLYALAGGGIAVALVGLIDDRRSSSAPVRLSVHFAAALWALWWLGGLPPLRVGTHLLTSGWLGYLFGALGIVWAINLFNFMDGIDGIAASEAIFVAVAASLALSVNAGIGAAALTFAAACGGFLVWNWSPARIFLGDVGSGYLGYVIVVLAVAATRDNPAALWVWLILGGAFFVDATVTLVRRTLRNERVHQAHRSHAYQWLARRWRSHGKVTVAFLTVDLLWLLPAALIAAHRPSYAVMAVIVAFAPLAILALAVGAGRQEAQSVGS
ncbi:MAG TPA: glycosyltransferase family 4 protein [Steroidobacteraceae bacterium]|jgi:Fuc2NAc and GlcNAc transferase|nr:glycosyltransferase family 4 protein [Steroidobacteraceae bacterium]